MFSECKSHPNDPIPAKQSFVVHVIETVGAVLLRLTAILPAYPYRGRVALREAEELAFCEFPDGSFLHVLRVSVTENMYKTVVRIATGDHNVECRDHAHARHIRIREDCVDLFGFPGVNSTAKSKYVAQTLQLGTSDFQIAVVGAPVGDLDVKEVEQSHKSVYFIAAQVAVLQFDFVHFREVQSFAHGFSFFRLSFYRFYRARLSRLIKNRMYIQFA